MALSKSFFLRIPCTQYVITTQTGNKTNYTNFYEVRKFSLNNSIFSYKKSVKQRSNDKIDNTYVLKKHNVKFISKYPFFNNKTKFKTINTIFHLRGSLKNLGLFNDIYCSRSLHTYNLCNLKGNNCYLFIDQYNCILKRNKRNISYENDKNYNKEEKSSKSQSMNKDSNRDNDHNNFTENKSHMNEGKNPDELTKEIEILKHLSSDNISDISGNKYNEELLSGHLNFEKNATKVPNEILEKKVDITKLKMFQSSTLENTIGSISANENGSLTFKYNANQEDNTVENKVDDENSSAKEENYFLQVESYLRVSDCNIDKNDVIKYYRKSTEEKINKYHENSAEYFENLPEIAPHCIFEKKDNESIGIAKGDTQMESSIENMLPNETIISLPTSNSAIASNPEKEQIKVANKNHLAFEKDYINEEKSLNKDNTIQNIVVINQSDNRINKNDCNKNVKNDVNPDISNKSNAKLQINEIPKSDCTADVTNKKCSIGINQIKTNQNAKNVLTTKECTSKAGLLTDVKSCISQSTITKTQSSKYHSDSVNNDNRILTNSKTEKKLEDSRTNITDKTNSQTQVTDVASFIKTDQIKEEFFNKSTVRNNLIFKENVNLEDSKLTSDTQQIENQLQEMKTVSLRIKKQNKLKDKETENEICNENENDSDLYIMTPISEESLKSLKKDAEDVFILTKVKSITEIKMSNSLVSSQLEDISEVSLNMNNSKEAVREKSISQIQNMKVDETYLKQSSGKRAKVKKQLTESGRKEVNDTNPKKLNKGSFTAINKLKNIMADSKTVTKHSCLNKDKTMTNNSSYLRNSENSKGTEKSKIYNGSKNLYSSFRKTINTTRRIDNSSKEFSDSNDIKLSKKEQSHSPKVDNHNTKDKILGDVSLPTCKKNQQKMTSEKVYFYENKTNSKETNPKKESSTAKIKSVEQQNIYRKRIMEDDVKRNTISENIFQEIEEINSDLSELMVDVKKYCIKQNNNKLTFKNDDSLINPVLDTIFNCSKPINESGSEDETEDLLALPKVDNFKENSKLNYAEDKNSLQFDHKLNKKLTVSSEDNSKTCENNLSANESTIFSLEKKNDESLKSNPSESSKFTKDNDSKNQSLSKPLENHEKNSIISEVTKSENNDRINVLNNLENYVSKSLESKLADEQLSSNLHEQPSTERPKKTTTNALRAFENIYLRIAETEEEDFEADISITSNKQSNKTDGEEALQEELSGKSVFRSTVNNLEGTFEDKNITSVFKKNTGFSSSKKEQPMSAMEYFIKRQISVSNEEVFDNSFIDVNRTQNNEEIEKNLNKSKILNLQSLQSRIPKPIRQQLNIPPSEFKPFYHKSNVNEERLWQPRENSGQNLFKNDYTEEYDKKGKHENELIFCEDGRIKLTTKSMSNNKNEILLNNPKITHEDSEKEMAENKLTSSEDGEIKLISKNVNSSTEKLNWSLHNVQITKSLKMQAEFQLQISDKSLSNDSIKENDDHKLNEKMETLESSIPPTINDGSIKEISPNALMEKEMKSLDKINQNSESYSVDQQVKSSNPKQDFIVGDFVGTKNKEVLVNHSSKVREEKKINSDQEDKAHIQTIPSKLDGVNKSSGEPINNHYLITQNITNVSKPEEYVDNSLKEYGGKTNDNKELSEIRSLITLLTEVYDTQKGDLSSVTDELLMLGKRYQEIIKKEAKTDKNSEEDMWDIDAIINDCMIEASSGCVLQDYSFELIDSKTRFKLMEEIFDSEYMLQNEILAENLRNEESKKNFFPDEFFGNINNKDENVSCKYVNGEIQVTRYLNNLDTHSNDQKQNCEISDIREIINNNFNSKIVEESNEISKNEPGKEFESTEISSFLTDSKLPGSTNRFSNSKNLPNDDAYKSNKTILQVNINDHEKILRRPYSTFSQTIHEEEINKKKEHIKIVKNKNKIERIKKNEKTKLQIQKNHIEKKAMQRKVNKKLKDQNKLIEKEVKQMQEIIQNIEYFKKPLENVYRETASDFPTLKRDCLNTDMEAQNREQYFTEKNQNIIGKLNGSDFSKTDNQYLMYPLMVVKDSFKFSLPLKKIGTKNFVLLDKNCRNFCTKSKDDSKEVNQIPKTSTPEAIDTNASPAVTENIVSSNKKSKHFYSKTSSENKEANQMSKTDKKEVLNTPLISTEGIVSRDKNFKHLCPKATDNSEEVNQTSKTNKTEVLNDNTFLSSTEGIVCSDKNFKHLCPKSTDDSKEVSQTSKTNKTEVLNNNTVLSSTEGIFWIDKNVKKLSPKSTDDSKEVSQTSKIDKTEVLNNNTVLSSTEGMVCSDKKVKNLFPKSVEECKEVNQISKTNELEVVNKNKPSYPTEDIKEENMTLENRIGLLNKKQISGTNVLRLIQNHLIKKLKQKIDKLENSITNNQDPKITANGKQLITTSSSSYSLGDFTQLKKKDSIPVIFSADKNSLSLQNTKTNVKSGDWSQHDGKSEKLLKATHQSNSSFEYLKDQKVKEIAEKDESVKVKPVIIEEEKNDSFSFKLIKTSADKSKAENISNKTLFNDEQRKVYSLKLDKVPSKEKLSTEEELIELNSHKNYSPPENKQMESTNRKMIENINNVPLDELMVVTKTIAKTINITDTVSEEKTHIFSDIFHDDSAENIQLTADVEDTKNKDQPQKDIQSESHNLNQNNSLKLNKPIKLSNEKTSADKQIALQEMIQERRKNVIDVNTAKTETSNMKFTIKSNDNGNVSDELAKDVGFHAKPEIIQSTNQKVQQLRESSLGPHKVGEERNILLEKNISLKSESPTKINYKITQKSRDSHIYKEKTYHKEKTVWKSTQLELNYNENKKFTSNKINCSLKKDAENKKKSSQNKEHSEKKSDDKKNKPTVFLYSAQESMCSQSSDATVINKKTIDDTLPENKSIVRPISRPTSSLFSTVQEGINLVKNMQGNQEQSTNKNAELNIPSVKTLSTSKNDKLSSIKNKNSLKNNAEFKSTSSQNKDFSEKKLGIRENKPEEVLYNEPESTCSQSSAASVIVKKTIDTTPAENQSSAGPITSHIFSTIQEEINLVQNIQGNQRQNANKNKKKIHYFSKKALRTKQKHKSLEISNHKSFDNIEDEFPLNHLGKQDTIKNNKNPVSIKALKKTISDDLSGPNLFIDEQAENLTKSIGDIHPDNVSTDRAKVVKIKKTKKGSKKNPIHTQKGRSKSLSSVKPFDSDISEEQINKLTILHKLNYLKESGDFEPAFAQYIHCFKKENIHSFFNEFNFPITNHTKMDIDYPRDPILNSLKYDNSFLQKIFTNLPSVSTVLNNTLPVASKSALIKWKSNVVNEVGVTGFEKLRQDRLQNDVQFHEFIQRHLMGTPLEDLLDGATPIVKKCLLSLKSVLHNVSKISFLEAHVVHRHLPYHGIIDCVARFDGIPVIIEWKQADSRMSLLRFTYDAPVQLAAYLGAFNHDKMYKFPVKSGLIIVAYTDGSPADTFPLSKEDCHRYWRVWLSRLASFLDLKKEY